MKKIHKSLRSSFLDGTFFSVMFGFGDTYLNAYAIALKASSFQIGLLSSLPGLLSALIQIKTPEWTEKVGRSRMINWGIFVQAGMWLPIILLPFFFPHSAVPWLIAMVTLYLLCGALTGPAWGSIMSQYLPRKSRGKYFSWRSRIHGAITLAATFAAGYILTLFPRQGITGFAVIFFVAMISRFISWYYLTKMYEPRLCAKPGASFTLRESNFVKFVFFIAATSFSVYLAAPFFAVYLLRELKFDYLSFTFITMVPTLATLATLGSWGRHTDRVGSIKVLQLTSLMIPLLPILWIFSDEKWYLVLIQALSGFAWAGFNLAASNFIYDAVSEEKRVRCISYFNLINGLGTFAGALLGGYLATRLPALYGSVFFSVFLLSGICRMLARVLLLPSLKEVKAVENVTTMELFFSVAATSTGVLNRSGSKE